MANAEQEAASSPEPQLEMEGGTYEIIRNRLTAHGRELRARLDKLNEARREVFGSIPTELVATERITTDHNCVPCDMASIGDLLLFGYNVHFGLKSETVLADVFAVYQFSEGSCHKQELDLIQDETFERDFKEVYRYYKNAVFSRFFVKGPFLYMVFQIGKGPNDVKSFKWSIEGSTLRYAGNRSDHEVKYPTQHGFEWKRTTREMHHEGEHPHISIEDRLFVETVGGDLTVKIENNTASGEGIYSEDVQEIEQTLDDAEIYYAIVGNIILLKVRPYQEKQFRYVVFNEKTRRAERLDSIARSCVLLPDDHGLIFSNGYYLQSGESKTLEQDANMLFERCLVAPNGEDYLYVFYNQDTGLKVLLPYNLIEQKIDSPLSCHGFTVFSQGELLCFKSQEEAQKHHAIQVWRTPFVGEEVQTHADTGSFLYKIGNRDIVRGMAECHEVLNLINKDDSYANLYLDLVRETSDLIDSYFWISAEETFNLSKPLAGIKEAASAAIDEYDKVVRVRRNTAQETARVQAETTEILQTVHHRRFETIEEFVDSLAQLRRIRGEIISLRELRYVDEETVDRLEQEASEQTERLSRRCVEFLLKPDSLAPYQQRVSDESARVDGLKKVSDAKAVEKRIVECAGELEMLIEIVGNLKIDDATQRTTIIDNISKIFSTVNQTRASLKAKIKELMSVEGVAEFNSQLKLLNQSVVNYLDICDSPDKCEEFLTKVMIQLEELEGRFAEFDEFVVQLTDKREEVYNAFETRKLALVEARNRRATALMNAADRILKGIATRVESFESVNDINGYFASDLMIEKVRDIIGQLEELEDSVKVDDIHSRLKTIREDAVRQLKDRQELFVGGENVIQFGSHQFLVNVQQLDLTTVLRDEQMWLHLTGTNFFETIEDKELNSLSELWEQEVVSESRNVYRGEYLAYKLFEAVLEGQDSQEEGGPTLPAFETLRTQSEEETTELVQRFMATRYTEAYSKGVHDHDASRVLRTLVEMKASIGLLRFHTRARALAAFYWRQCADKKDKPLMTSKLQGFGAICGLFPETPVQQQYIRDLHELLQEFVSRSALFPESFVREAAQYLFAELTVGSDFAVSRIAADLHDSFWNHLKANDYVTRLQDSLKAVKREPTSCLLLARDWVTAFLPMQSTPHDPEQVADYVDEVAAMLVAGKVNRQRVLDGTVVRDVNGMVGSHATIESGTFRLSYNEFMQKLSNYTGQVVPQYRRYIERKKELVEAAREELRLDEFRPRVLTSFVRNRLIDEVYLPLVGDNLAKQIGVAGENKRTDLMGLLLLLSPPGYGKTTLMEYIANRLGVIFMKINGPAIGHQVTSLDPTEAPNAAAREEIEKLNLSLEMGDNVMIYLDDIQHCNPEFLQKFISLCDAQRKIEGVYKGKTRTYDLRGRKVVVVMAGNPYTESGEKFQIPDMLSNRADVYNLGEIIGDTAEAFEMSYLENALTSNPVLSKLASRSQKDVHGIIRMATEGTQEGIDLEGNYSLEELNDFVTVMTKLLRVRDVILTVNREYIRSAAQSDDYRTEPAFKLQGSYRNMNRIAEKVVPIMNDAELETLIISNYENDSQTLTSDNEANMLKFRELLDILTTDERVRWDNIKHTFKQNVRMKGVGEDDQLGRVLVQLSSFGDGLREIKQALEAGVKGLTARDSSEDGDGQYADLLGHLDGMKSGMDNLGQVLSQGIEHWVDQAASSEPTAAIDPGVIKELVESLASKPGSGEFNGGPPQKVIVQHRVPRVLLEVVKNQFELMKDWMVPVLNASNLQSGDIQLLQKSIDDNLNGYARLIELLEKPSSQASKPS